MTRDDVIRWARQAGMRANVGYTDRDGKHHPAVNALSSSVPVKWLELFASLAVAEEREECAKVCEHFAMALDHGGNEYLRSRECQLAAMHIRGRAAS